MDHRMVRRVVTGSRPDGRSFVADQQSVDPITVAALPGYAWYRLWSLDEAPTHPAPPEEVSRPDHFPPAPGVRFYVFEVPPGRGRRPDPSREAEEELEAKLPGRSQHMETGQDGMHITPTVDFVYVVSGTITLVLDDAEVALAPGDTVIQNGTRHAWRNDGDTPCRLVVAQRGAVPPG